MNLNEALTQIASQLHLDPLVLTEYAVYDQWGGYHDKQDDGFPVGSMWRVEGLVIYALIRALKPLSVLELGTSHGCSATHILQALADNGRGSLTSVDNGSQIGVPGEMIPDNLRSRWILHNMDLEIYLRLPDTPQYDFILEDAMHSPEQVEFIYRQLPRILKPGGVIVSHDAAHFLVGKDVQRGIRAAGYSAYVYLIEPSDCGLSILRYEA